MHNYLLNYLKRDKAYKLMGEERGHYEGVIAQNLGISMKLAKRMLKRDVWRNTK